MSLKDLQDSVLADAALHLPDINYDLNSNDHSVKFEPLPLSTLIDESEDDVAGLKIETDRQDLEKAQAHNYAFTRWSRSQLLSLFGTKEKWFSLVNLERQVDELNARRPGLSGYRIRTMRTVDENFPVRLVRGLVSGQYSEIKNVAIMDAIASKIDPESKVLRGYSGISDRAFYAYIVAPSPITIPGTDFLAYPGALVKNSEVGYTSLWVIPTLVTKRFDAPIILEGKHVFKRVHRGTPDLHGIFLDAFAKCSVTWADMTTKIPALVAKTYANEDEAVAAMQRMLTTAKAKAEFVADCASTYKSKARAHTALDIFEVIVEVCGRSTDRDETYTAGAIAGAVLHRLVH